MGVLSDFILAWGGGEWFFVSEDFINSASTQLSAVFFPPAADTWWTWKDALLRSLCRRVERHAPILRLSASFHPSEHFQTLYAHILHKGNSQVPKVRYRTRFDKDTEPINNNNTEVLSNKRAGEINDILDGWTTQAASRGPASGSPGGIAAAKINLALGQTHF